MGQSSRCGGAWFLATSPPSGAADLWWGASHDRCHDAWRRVTCHEWRQLQMLASLLTISLSPSDQMMQCPCPLLYFTLYDISTNIRFSRLKLSSHQCQCHFVCVFFTVSLRNSFSVCGVVYKSFWLCLCIIRINKANKLVSENRFSVTVLLFSPDVFVTKTNH